MNLYAGFYATRSHVDRLLELCGLTGQAGTRNGRLSGGQQRRLDVALALVGEPELLFLDEPTTGFDPAARRSAWSMISGLKALGTTVVLTTHYLEEAEALSTGSRSIDAGRIVAEGTPATLGGRDRAPTTSRSAWRVARRRLPAASRRATAASASRRTIRPEPCTS